MGKICLCIPDVRLELSNYSPPPPPTKSKNELLMEKFRLWVCMEDTSTHAPSPENYKGKSELFMENFPKLEKVQFNVWGLHCLSEGCRLVLLVIPFNLQLYQTYLCIH